MSKYPGYPGPVKFTRIQGRGSGEYLDREDLLAAERAVGAGGHDLVVVEDLGRICRRNRALDFCEQCEDTNTRLVAINDHIDTARGDWRLNAFFAAFKHEMSNADTSARIKRSQANRFTQGGVVQTLVYGYVKPVGAKSDAEIRKDPDAEPVYDEIFRRLEDGAGYAEVADWLNDRNIPPGKWARSDSWDGRMLGRVVQNPILKGVRVRNTRKSVRVNRTGRRKSVKTDPGERLERSCPHLAFIAPERYDRVIALLRMRNGHFAWGRAAGSPDTRAGVSRKRTVWPGQHVVCGVCGRPFYWGGHGEQGHLMCAGARDYRCWNGATFDGGDTARRLTAAILAVVEELPEFDAAFQARVQIAAEARNASRGDDRRRVEQELEALGREMKNLLDTLQMMGASPALAERLRVMETRKAELEFERAEILGREEKVPTIPPMSELKRRTREALRGLPFDDPEFGRMMRRLVPRLEVRPCRLIDGGKVVLRAHLTLEVVSLLDRADGLDDLIRKELVVDLFDPPQRAAFRDRVVALRVAGRTERQAATELGLTLTAAQRAAVLDREMRVLGVTDPYQLVTNPPADDGRCRRHRHHRYKFLPQAGYPAWETEAR